MTEFIGFPRPDGSIGIRNHVIIIGMGSSGANVCHKVAGLVKGTIPVLHNPGNGILSSEIVSHPNVAGIVVVGDGPEEETAEGFISDLERTGKPHEVIDIGGSGLLEAISKTTQTAIEIIRDVSTQRRELVRVSKLLPGLLNIHANSMADVLQGFLQLVMDENGRCLWVEKETKSDGGINSDIKKNLAGDLKPGQTPGPNPGVYKYRGPEKVNTIWKAMLASGAQIMASPVEKGRCMAHPLIPTINFLVDQDTGSSDICDLDLSQVKDGQLAVENAGLLLLSEILATASGKLTREEILRDIVMC